MFSEPLKASYLVAWALYLLQLSANAPREGQDLVTGGVFKYIRHPSYAGIWLWALAQPLLIQNWIAGPAMALTFLPLYLPRVPREEEGLARDAAFP